jgi:hypothetical protein
MAPLAVVTLRARRAVRLAPGVRHRLATRPVAQQAVLVLPVRNALRVPPARAGVQRQVGVAIAGPAKVTSRSTIPMAARESPVPARLAHTAKPAPLAPGAQT